MNKLNILNVLNKLKEKIFCLTKYVAFQAESKSINAVKSTKYL